MSDAQSPVEKPQSLDQLRAELGRLSDCVQMYRTKLDDLAMDVRALNTAMHNTMLAFGASRERVEHVQSLIKSVSGSSASEVAKVSELASSKMADFRYLCETRTSAIISKIDAVKMSSESLIVMSERNLNDKISGHDERLDSIESDIKKAAVAVIVTFLGYLAKLSWPTIFGGGG